MCHSGLSPRGENYGCWRLSHPSIDFHLTISEYGLPVILKRCAELKLTDLVVDKVMAPDKPGFQCIEKGALLTDFNMRKIFQASRAAPKDWTIPVVELSPMAKTLHHGA